MEENHNEPRCCGAAVNAVLPDLVLAIAMLSVNDAKATVEIYLPLS
jgi:hypothetical protein